MLLALSLISCDSTELTSGLCDLSQSSVGIEGNYRMNTFGEVFSVEIIETGYGTYTFTYTDPDGDVDSADLKTCRIGGEIFVDIEEPFETITEAMKFEIVGGGLIFKSVLFNHAILTQMGFPFETRDDLGREITNIDNRNIPANTLLLAEETQGEPLELILTKL